MTEKEKSVSADTPNKNDFNDVCKDTGNLPYLQHFSAQIVNRQIMEDMESNVEVQKIDENTILYKIDTRFLNPEKPIPPTKTWAKIGGRPAITCNGIVLINAKPKQGKSYSVYAILSSLIRGEKFDTLQPLAVPSRCIVFDTEMSEIDLQTRIIPLYNAIGDDNRAKFQVCSLLSTPKQERLNVIMQIVEQYDPPIVAIDQVADLMADFNSSVEAVAVFERLKVLMAERTVFIIIHQNKAKDDMNSKGHAGTLAEQNCSEYYSIKREKGFFELFLRTSRFTSADDAEPLRFALNEDGGIVSCDDILRNNERQQREGFSRNFANLLGDDEEMPYNELVSRIMERENLGERQAKDKISNAYKVGSLTKEKKKKNVYYRIVPI